MKICRVLVLCLFLSGCHKAAMNDTVVSYDSTVRVALQEKAGKGDAEAQFALGNSYCCGENGFWDTQQAVHWWCLAAAQGHAGAQQRLDGLKAACVPPAAAPAPAPGK